MFFEEIELPTFREIETAEQQLQNMILMTPMEYSHVAADLAHNDIHIKWDNLQHTGSSKLRGALYKLQSLNAEERSRGLITASWGNHGLGLAYAARFYGIKCTVVTPKITNKALISALAQHKAKVIPAGTSYGQAYETAQQLAEQQQSIFIDASRDTKIIAGQGTLGLEIVNQLPGTDAVVVPVSGGGLALGVALAVKSLNPKVKVYGVKIPNSHDQQEQQQQHPLTSRQADTLNLLQAQTERWLDDMFNVTEDEAARAVVLMMHHHKLVAEEVGALAVAAAIHQKIPPYTGNVVTLVSGGNVDMSSLPQLIQRGLTLFD